MHDDARSFASARLSIARVRVGTDVTLQQACAHVCRVSARALQLARVSVWFFDETGHELHCAHLLIREGQPGPDIRVLSADDYPRYISALKKNRWVCAADAQSDADTAEFRDAYLVPLGITSMLDAPIFSSGEIVGIVCHEHIGPKRVWAAEDRAFAGSVADIIALVIEQEARVDAETALRLAEDRMYQSQKMEALGRLSSAVAHDFNNFLTAIDAFATSIERAHPDVAEASRIRDVASRGAALTRQLLAFGRPAPSSRRNIDLGATVAGLSPILSTLVQGACEISLTAPEGAFVVHADPIEIQQIVLNLSLNARDAMPEGGTLAIAVEPFVARDALEDASRYVTLRVSDTGIGMDDTTRERAFEPFFTTKEQGVGTGLGLATVFSVTRGLGGFVDLESRPGTGTTFRVVLPRVPS